MPFPCGSIFGHCQTGTWTKWAVIWSSPAAPALLRTLDIVLPNCCWTKFCTFPLMTYWLYQPGNTVNKVSQYTIWSLLTTHHHLFSAVMSTKNSHQWLQLPWILEDTNWGESHLNGGVAWRAGDNVHLVIAQESSTVIQVQRAYFSHST